MRSHHRVRNNMRLGLIVALLVGGSILTGSGIAGRMIRSAYYRIPVHIPGIPPCPGCNVVIIALDVLRADALPCYGNQRNTAPKLCAYAKKNSYFTRYYSESSYTMDTVVSMMTGMLPTTHHMLSPFTDRLNPNIPTLAQIFHDRGYETVYSGSTDDLNLPLDLGLGRGFDAIYTTITDPADWPEQYGRFLKKLGGKKPVFMFMHSYAMHDPYLVGTGPRKYVSGDFSRIPLTKDQFRVRSLDFFQFAVDEFASRFSASDTDESKTRNKRIMEELQRAVRTRDIPKAQKVIDLLYSYEQYDLYVTWNSKYLDPDNPAMAAYLRGLYDEQVTHLDDALQPLLAYVSRPDIARRTVVIITAPHGEEFAEHGHYLHDNNIYNAETHVPFIIAAPRIQNGVYDTPAQGTDILPTVLDLLGIPVPVPTDGKSLASVLQGEALPPPVYTVSEHRGNDILAISTGRWKYYQSIDPETKLQWSELYDLQSDPGEHKNVIGAHPDIASTLSIVLNQRIEKHQSTYPPIQTDFPLWIDAIKRKELIENGYF